MKSYPFLSLNDEQYLREADELAAACGELGIEYKPTDREEDLRLLHAQRELHLADRLGIDLGR